MPLQNPANYMLQLPDPTKVATDQLKLALGIRDSLRSDQLVASQVQENVAQAQQAQAKMTAQQRMQEGLAALAQNPTVANVRRTMLLYPEIGEHYKTALESLTAEDRSGRIKLLGQAHAAQVQGALPAALKLFGDARAAYQNSGMAQDAAGIQQIMDLSSSNPNAARGMAASMLAAELGPDKYAETYGKFEKLPDELREGAAKATTAQVDAAFAAPKALLDMQKTRGEIAKQGRDAAGDTGLTAPGQKAVNDAVANAEADASIAEKARNLRAAIEKERKSWPAGIGGSLSQRIRAAGGTQSRVDGLTEMYQGFINSLVRAELRGQGVQTDADYANAAKAYPSANGDADRILDLLSSKGAESELRSKVGGLKSEWLKKNAGDAGSANRAFKINGIDIGPGDTFEKVRSSLLPKAPTSAMWSPDKEAEMAEITKALAKGSGK
jgi:hypothetical protein